jgi:hypothetical protein
MISLFPNPKRNYSRCYKKQKQVIIPTIDSLHIEEKSVDGLTKVAIATEQ